MMMTRKMWMMCGCLTAGVVLAQVEGTYDKIVTDGKFVSPNGDQYGVEGVCHFTEDKVDCWDFAGVRSPALTERVTARLSSESYNQVNVRYGGRSLLVLTTTSKDNSYGSWTVADERNNSYLSSMGSGLSSISLPKERRTFSLATYLSGIVPNKVATASLVPGQTSTVFGSKWKLASATTMAPTRNAMSGYDPYGSNPDGPMWHIVFEAVGASEQVLAYGTSLVAFQSDGTPVRFVDAKGVPLTDAKYLELTGMRGGYSSGMNPGVKPKAFSATLSMQQQLEKAASLTTNINPKYINSVKLTVSTPYRVKFENIPAYPKE